jgi:hypothetical protein
MIIIIIFFIFLFFYPIRHIGLNIFIVQYYKTLSFHSFFFSTLLDMQNIVTSGKNIYLPTTSASGRDNLIWRPQPSDRKSPVVATTR